VIGALALSASDCGTVDNTAVGFKALTNAVGGGNIALGAYSGSNLVAGGGNIYIGNLGVATESGTIRIGDGNTATYIAGISGATNSGGVAVYVNASGQLGTLTSSARFKENIREIGQASSGLMKLHPVRFRYKKDIDPSGLEQYGLVAEDVAKVYPNLVVYDDKGQPQTVRYHFVNAMLLNEVQKQARQIADQGAQIAEQREMITAQAHQLTQLTEQTRRVADQAHQIETLTARLDQIAAALDSAGAAAAVPVRGTDGRGL
jgi:hypothetical protein